MIRLFKLITLLAISWGAAATPAYYKEIPLQDVVRIRAGGHITLELKQGDSNKLEIYFRKNSSHRLKVGLSEKNGNQQLLIREVLVEGLESEDQVIAHLIVTSNQIKKVTLAGVHQFQVDGYQAEKLELYIEGQTKAALSQLEVEHLILNASFKSQVELSSSDIQKLTLVSRSKSQVALQHVHSVESDFDTRGESKLKLDSFSASVLKLKSRHSSRVDLLETSQINHASVIAKDESAVVLNAVQHVSVERAETATVTHNGQRVDNGDTVADKNSRRAPHE